MGTSAAIGKLEADGSVRSIYVHWDGYIRGGVGEMLCTHYTDETKINKLLDLGDLSFLGEDAISDPLHWRYDKSANPRACCSYRDRGDTCVQAKVSIDADAYRRRSRLDFTYLWDGSWKVATDGGWVAIELS